MKKIEYAIMAKTTNKVFPKIFANKEEAEKNRKMRADYDHWDIVKREVEYGEWENL